MPVTGKARAPHRRCPTPSNKLRQAPTEDSTELNCKQVSLQRRAKTTSPKACVQKTVEPTNIVKPSLSQDELFAPLRVHIRVRAPKATKITAPPSSPRNAVKVLTAKTSSKTPLQQGNEDKWILHNTATNDARIQSLAPYQYNSIEQRKDSKGKSRQKTPTAVTLTPTCTPSPKRNDRSKSADSAISRTTKSHETQIPNNGCSSNPYILMQGIPARRTEIPTEVDGEEEISLNTQQLLDHYKRIMGEGLHCPSSSTIPTIDRKTSHTKAYTMKSDGSIVSSDFYILKDGSEQDAERTVQRQNEIVGGHHIRCSPISPRESQKRKQKNGGCKESYLSDANILEIMEKDSYRFETFDTSQTSCRQPQYREPLIEMPEKRWKVKNPDVGHQNVGKQIVGVSAHDRSRWAFSDANMTFSEVLSNINDVKGVEPYRSTVRPGSECRCNSKTTDNALLVPRPLSSPPSVSKSEVSIWGEKRSKSGTGKSKDSDTTKNSVVNKSLSKKKVPENCEKSRSSSELGRLKDVTSEIIARIERSQSKGKSKTKRPSSPRVAESRSLYDYRTLVI